MTEPAARDEAWVTIETPLKPGALIEFCRDVERLYRINSQLEVLEWRALGDGRHAVRLRNLGNDHLLEAELTAESAPHGVTVRYDRGLKASTEFRVAAKPPGATLTIRDDYGRLPEAERAARIDEIDRSLVTWGHDLHRYFRRWHRWSWCGPWRWYMRRVWLPMKPSARRIAFLVVAVSVAEFLAFLFVFAIFWLEFHVP